MDKSVMQDLFLVVISVNLINLCPSALVKDNFLLVNDVPQNQILQYNLITAETEAVKIQPSHVYDDVAYDPVEDMVFWFNTTGREIKASTIDGKYQTTVISMNNASLCGGLAADYINKLLFFTDAANDVIGVVSTRYYQLFTYSITDSLDQPRDIVVSPNQGIIYWSDWGRQPRIETSNMDGSKRRTIVAFNPTAWPNGLALDLQENQLFWVDGYTNKISVIDLESSRIRILLQETDAHYFGVDVIGKYLYVTDWNRSYLLRMNKEGGQVTKFGSDKFEKLCGIKGYNSSESVKGISVCATSECEHLCLPRGNDQYSCRCVEGYISQGSQCKHITDSSVTSEDDVINLSISSIVSMILSAHTEYDNNKHVSIETENGSLCTYDVPSK